MISYYLDVWKSFVASGLLGHELVHALVLIPSMFFVWKRTKSSKLIVLVFAVGLLMDVDHFFDYWIYKGSISFNLVNFFRLDYFRSNGFGLVLFHGWEYVVICYFIFRKKGWKSLSVVFLLGMLPHLIWDSYSIRSFLFYSILYRVFTGFSLPNL